VPTLAVGDRIAVTPLSYGFSRFSVPFIGNHLSSLPGEEGRIGLFLPERGDIAVFAHPVTGDAWVKRVIGLPGDHIAVVNGELIVNGAKIARDKTGAFSVRDSEGQVVAVTAFAEHFPGKPDHTIYQRERRWSAGDMKEITVPQGHLFMMGDNRDNSLDSRFADLGPVPIENLLGKAHAVLWSLSSCDASNGLHCDKRHWLQSAE